MSEFPGDPTPHLFSVYGLDAQGQKDVVTAKNDPAQDIQYENARRAVGDVSDRRLAQAGEISVLQLAGINIAPHITVDLNLPQAREAEAS